MAEIVRLAVKNCQTIMITAKKFRADMLTQFFFILTFMTQFFLSFIVTLLWLFKRESKWTKHVLNFCSTVTLLVLLYKLLIFGNRFHIA